MEREIKHGRLVVDGAWCAHFGLCFQIGDEKYQILNLESEITAPKQQNIKKIAYIPESAVPFVGYEYAMAGLYPRQGYGEFIRPLGRAITGTELEALRKEYNVDDESISEPFVTTHHGCFGAPEEYHEQYTAVQIAVDPMSAMPLEEKLQEMGIEASNCSAGRITIRVA